MSVGKLNIAIDMRGLQTYSLHRGIGVHWREIMKKLMNTDQRSQYILIYAKNFPAADDDLIYPDNYRKIYVKVPFFRKKISLFYLWSLDQQRIYRILKNNSVDIAILTTFAEVWFPGKKFRDIPTITWVYDMIPFIFEEKYFRKVKYGALKRYFMNKKIKNTQEMDYIITSSQSGKQDWLKFAEYPENRVIVNPLGVNENYHKFAQDEKKIDGVRKKYNLDEKFIFYLGGVDPRKNLHRALKGYAIAREKISLPNIVIAGNINKQHRDYFAVCQQIRKYNLDDCVRFVGFIPDEHLPVMYGLAEFLLFPSLCEGFGLPVLEAMASGCPVLTSNISAMPEVAGDCAFLVRPHSAESIADGIIQIIQNNDLRNKMINCGKQRAKKFSWERTARNLLNIIEKVVNNE